MTALITADWHHTEQARDRYRFRAMSFIADLIDKHKVDQLIILGDLTHNKNHHSDVLVNDIVDLLNDLASICQLYINQGNHDYVEADTAFFHFVRLLEGVRWYRLPTRTFIKGLGEVLFLPHTRDHTKDWAGVDWSRLDWIFAHNAFEGALSETGKKLRGIPLDVFPDGVPIIAGDIHKPQKLGWLTYVGSPYTQKFGDDYKPRVLLIDRGEIVSIPVPGPQKVLIEVDSMVELDDAMQTCSTDDMIKVRYRLPSDQREHWPQMLKTIKDTVPGAIVQPIVEKAQSLPWESKAGKSDKELVQAYGDQQKLSKDTMDIGYELIA
jgi:hypothetical protein